MPIKQESITLKRITVTNDPQTVNFKVAKTKNFMGHLPGDVISKKEAQTLKDNRHLQVFFTE